MTSHSSYSETAVTTTKTVENDRIGEQPPCAPADCVAARVEAGASSFVKEALTAPVTRWPPSDGGWPMVAVEKAYIFRRGRGKASLLNLSRAAVS